MRSVQIAVLTVGAVAALVALAGCGSSKAHGEEGTVKLTQPGGSSNSTSPIGKATAKGLPPGSGLAISNQLQNSEKKTVGELDAACIITQPSNESINGTCTATAIVPGGSFALNAGGKGIGGGNGVSGSIVGGTGKYNGALGNFSSKPISNAKGGPKEVTFNYILP
jgi:hypothetical protein